MDDEYWGTFSIYDHRKAIYRQALLLFDRIVVPIPIRPVGNLTEPEIDTLDREVQELERRGAARRFEWDPDEFLAWKREKEKPQAGEAEATARILVDDPPFLTRLMLKEKAAAAVASLRNEAISVTAVPVYGSQQSLENSGDDLRGYVDNRFTIDVLMPQFPMPAADASFDDILRVRDSAQFRESLHALRTWQRKRIKEILEEKDEAAIRRAAADFERMVKKFRESLADAKYTKVTTAVTSMLAVGAAFSAVAGPVIGLLAAVASPLFTIRGLLKPSWKELEDKECFPAGVVLAAEELA